MQKITTQIKLVVFSVMENSLAVWLKDGLLPFVAVSSEISLEEQIKELFLQTFGTQLGNNYSEQLYTFSDDPQNLTIVYYILLPSITLPIAKPEWILASNIQKNIDDKKIIDYAIQRLRWKIEYTNVVYSLLPKEFSLSDLQKIYEAILGHVLDKRNFRKKILSLHFLKSTGKKRIGISRPALIYLFKERKPHIIKTFS